MLNWLAIKCNWFNTSDATFSYSLSEMYMFITDVMDSELENSFNQNGVSSAVGF